MARLVLDIKYDYDFILVGIACHHKEYRLCHDLNNLLSTSMARLTDLELVDKKNHVLAFTHYAFQNSDGDQYDLLGNKCPKGFLLPEHKQFDYLLMVNMVSDSLSESELLKTLKLSKLVLAAFAVEAHKLKSKENLIF